MLTDDEIEDMGADLDLSLPDLADVLRPARTDDSGGGSTITDEEAYSDLAVRVSPSDMTPDERIIADRVQALMLWDLTFPAGSDIRAADRITVGARTFEVIAPKTRRSFEISCRVYCVEMG